jgi:hypothetical protein
MFIWFHTYVTFEKNESQYSSRGYNEQLLIKILTEVWADESVAVVPRYNACGRIRLTRRFPAAWPPSGGAWNIRKDLKRNVSRILREYYECNI